MHWTAGVRSPTEAEDFSSNLCDQTGSGTHPVFCTIGAGGKEQPGRDADRSRYLVPRLRKTRIYNFSSPRRLDGV
jgi:hypothetical protein